MTNYQTYWILEGDYGGQIYATIPVSRINVPVEKLAFALDEIGKVEWPEEDGEDASLYQIEGRPGEVVSGGMGGGRLTNGIWMHPDLHENLKEWLPRFLTGEIDIDCLGNKIIHGEFSKLRLCLN